MWILGLKGLKEECANNTRAIITSQALPLQR